MRVELLSRYEDLASLSDEWNALAGDAPLLRWEWLGSWWRHYGRGHRPFAPAVWSEEDELIGIAPWFLESHPALGRVVRFLGSGEVCTDYLRILAAEGREQEVTDAIADWLDETGNCEAQWDQIEFDGAASDEPSIWRLIERLADKGNTLHRRDGMSCWRIELPATWGDYLAQLSKTHRRQVRRALERAEEIVAVLHVATPETFPRAWEAFVDLHQRRRESLGEPGCFANERFHDFLKEASQQMLAAGSLRLCWLEAGGRPIAVEHMLHGGNVIYAYQSGVDPERLADEPGRMMAALLIRGAIEEGRAGFDFLRGDEPYKAHWRAQPRRMTEWRIVPRRALPQLRHTAWLAGGAMKHWLQTTYTRFAPAQKS
jgi:CelD/BcsL family acetyltransferase involved in cellulose biosynthesis